MKEKLPRSESSKPLVGKSFEEVVKIKALHEERIMGGVNVVGIGVSMHETKRTRQFAIKVYLNQQLAPEEFKRMEKEIDGVPLLYQTVEIIRAY